MVIWFFILYYQGEFGSHCKAPNSLYKSGNNKACCPTGRGGCAEIRLACFILLPSLERKQRLAVQSSLALMCRTHCSPSQLPTQQDLRSPGCCFLATGRNLLCVCSLDLIWGLKLCCVFLRFLDSAALPSWQENTVFPPHLEVISALGLQWVEKTVLCFQFTFCFLLSHKACLLRLS